MSASLTKRFTSIGICLLVAVLVCALALTSSHITAIRVAAIAPFLLVMFVMTLVTEHWLLQLIGGGVLATALTGATAALVEPIKLMETSGNLTNLALWPIVAVAAFSAVLIEITLEAAIEHNQTFTVKTVEKEIPVDLFKKAAEDMTPVQFWDWLNSNYPLVFESLKHDFQTQLQAAKQQPAMITAQATSSAKPTNTSNGNGKAPAAVPAAALIAPKTVATPVVPAAAAKSDDTAVTPVVTSTHLLVEGMRRAYLNIAANKDFIRWMFHASFTLGQMPLDNPTSLDKSTAIGLINFLQSDEVFEVFKAATAAKTYTARQLKDIHPLLKTAMERVLANTPEDEIDDQYKLFLNFFFGNLAVPVQHVDYKPGLVWQEFLKGCYDPFMSIQPNVRKLPANSPFNVKVVAPAPVEAPAVSSAM